MIGKNSFDQFIDKFYLFIYLLLFSYYMYIHLYL